MTTPTVRAPQAATTTPTTTRPSAWTALPPPARPEPSRLTARARFAAALAGPPRPGEAATAAPARPEPKPTTAKRPPARTEPEAATSKAPRRPEARHEAVERDPSELAAFRVLPSVLQPPAPVAPPPTARTDVARLAEQLVTRLRVGRTREGAMVELRLSLGDRELDVRLLETPHGLTLQLEGDDALHGAIQRELLARGLPLST